MTIVSKLASLVEWNLKLIAKEGRSGFPLLLGTRISRVFSSILGFGEKTILSKLKIKTLEFCLNNGKNFEFFLKNFVKMKGVLLYIALISTKFREFFFMKFEFWIFYEKIVKMKGVLLCNFNVNKYFFMNFEFSMKKIVKITWILHGLA